MRSALLLATLLLLAVVPAGAQGQIPAEPGPVWDPQDSLFERDQKALSAAVERASEACGRRIVVVVNPPGDSPDEMAKTLEMAWPDRVILFVFWHSWDVRLHTPLGMTPEIPPETAERVVKEVKRALSERTMGRTVARVVGEIGETLAGHPPKPWQASRHPYQVLAGGQDADPLPLAADVGITLGALALLGLFLRALITHPKAVLLGIGMDLVECVIGGAIGSIGGGGDSGGGGSFSGGGGSSGGGGANGSW
jgi:uncharacterized membrane protein YgcG